MASEALTVGAHHHERQEGCARYTSGGGKHVYGQRDLAGYKQSSGPDHQQPEHDQDVLRTLPQKCPQAARHRDSGLSAQRVGPVGVSQPEERDGVSEPAHQDDRRVFGVPDLDHVRVFVEAGRANDEPPADAPEPEADVVKNACEQVRDRVDAFHLVPHLVPVDVEHTKGRYSEHGDRYNADRQGLPGEQPVAEPWPVSVPPVFHVRAVLWIWGGAPGLAFGHAHVLSLVGGAVEVIASGVAAFLAAGAGTASGRLCGIPVRRGKARGVGDVLCQTTTVSACGR